MLFYGKIYYDNTGGINMVFEKVKAIILDQISVPAEKVTLDARLVEDLGADSLDAVELIMSVEEEFDIEVPDDAARSIKTIRDVVNFIEANK